MFILPALFLVVCYYVVIQQLWISTRSVNAMTRVDNGQKDLEQGKPEIMNDNHSMISISSNTKTNTNNNNNSDRDCLQLTNDDDDDFPKKRSHHYFNNYENQEGKSWWILRWILNLFCQWRKLAKKRNKAKSNKTNSSKQTMLYECSQTDNQQNVSEIGNNNSSNKLRRNSSKLEEEQCLDLNEIKIEKKQHHKKKFKEKFHFLCCCCCCYFCCDHKPVHNMAINNIELSECTTMSSSYQMTSYVDNCGGGAAAGSSGNERTNYNDFEPQTKRPIEKDNIANETACELVIDDDADDNDSRKQANKSIFCISQSLRTNSVQLQHNNNNNNQQNKQYRPFHNNVTEVTRSRFQVSYYKLFI